MPAPSSRVVVDDGTPRIGDVIADKYEVTRVLGTGGMGVVVAVKHLQLREPYAMKFLHRQALDKPEAVERFLREARAAVRIKSEQVARVADVGQLPDGAPYLLMEYLEGRDLASMIEEGPLPIPDAVECIMQACAGIAEAHAIGIIHRDLKPSNLFLTRRSDGAPLIKVLDFGIAKALETSEDAPALTVTQAVFGTPAYMSPEQIRSAKYVDFRTDIWALGVILYELLAGKMPFKAESSAAMLVAISADPPIPLRGRRPEIAPELEAVVMRCLEKDKTKRFQTIGELVTALGPLGEKTTISLNRIKRLETTTSSRALASGAATVGPAELAPTVAAVPHEPKRSSPLLIIALAATAVAAAAIGMVVFLITRPPAKPPAPAIVVETVTVPAPSAPIPSASAAPIASVAPTQTATSTGPRPPRPHPGVTPPAHTTMAAPVPAPAPAPKVDPSADSH